MGSVGALAEINFSEAPFFVQIVLRVALGKITNTTSLTVSEALAAGHHLLLHCLRVNLCDYLCLLDKNKPC